MSRAQENPEASSAHPADLSRRSGISSDVWVGIVLAGITVMVVVGWIWPWLMPLPAGAAVAALLNLRRERRRTDAFVQDVAEAITDFSTEKFTRPTYGDSPEFDRIGALLAEKNDLAMRLISRSIQAEMAFDAVFHALYGPAIQVDHDATVERINGSVSSIFQISPQEAIGRPFLHVVRDHRIEESLTESMAEVKSVSVDVEVVAAKHPGRYRVRIEPMVEMKKDGSQHVRGAIVLLFDVTRLRFLERVRSEFVSNISHELRTPITAVKGFIETILEEDMPMADRERFLRIVKEEVDRLEGLLVDLLELSLLESDTKPLEREPVDVGQLVTTTITVLEPQATKKRMTVENRIAAGLPTVPANRKMLEQAVFNLVENALKYTQEGGAVWIDARRIATDYFEITVSDNGPGIPSDHLPRIFQRFHRVDPARTRSEGGTGLGLAIVHHIIQRHGGSVRAESRLGKGSRFIIMIPLRPPKPLPTEWET